MVDRCRKLYNVETQMPPAYLQARNHLYEGRIDDFIDIMKSLISSVPYNVHKEKIDEGNCWQKFCKEGTSGNMTLGMLS